MRFKDLTESRWMETWEAEVDGGMKVKLNLGYAETLDFDHYGRFVSHESSTTLRNPEAWSQDRDGEWYICNHRVYPYFEPEDVVTDENREYWDRVLHGLCSGDMYAASLNVEVFVNKIKFVSHVEICELDTRDSNDEQRAVIEDVVDSSDILDESIAAAKKKIAEVAEIARGL